ncbi:MAG: hypothetical protein AAF870_03075 [Pseudomonadota bacterium]
MKNKLLIASAALAAFSSLAIAKNTNDDWKWKNTHYKTFGEWTTACEDRSDDESVKRCYLRYVDAYAREPFGAFFVFVTTSKEGPSFSFEFERGTKLPSDWTVSAGDKQIWTFDPAQCPSRGECILSTAQGTKLAKALAAPGAALNFKFTDREDRVLDRNWPGDSQFADAFYDLQTQTAKRTAN